jgi:predicted ABC-type sugar transport system permease subunit
MRSEKELPDAEISVTPKSKSALIAYQERWWRVFNRFGPAIMLLAVVAGMSIAHPEFLTVPNLLTIGLQAAVRAMLAIGVLLVVVSGGIDLSIGTSMSLSMVTMGMYVINSHGSLSIGMLIAIGTGILVGLVNGTLIAFLQLPPIHRHARYRTRLRADAEQRFLHVRIPQGVRFRRRRPGVGCSGANYHSCCGSARDFFHRS